MRFKVKVKEPSTGELKMVVIDAETKEQAYEIAHQQILTMQKQRETKERIKALQMAEELEEARLRRDRKIAKEEAEKAERAEAEKTARQEVALLQAENAKRLADEERLAESNRQARARRIAALTVGPQRWRYKMVQIPPNIEIKEGQKESGVASSYLESIVHVHSTFGWEFQRVDEIGIIVNPGCLAGLFGVKAKHTSYFVVTFRCPVGLPE